jgi:glycosyltransferase involved in cell wall biosynthesis
MASMAGWLLWSVGSLATLAWLGLASVRLRALLRVPLLSRLRADPPARWPSVSLVSAACDEGRTVGPALESWLAQSYPELDAVVVDDRSTDETGAVLDALAERHPRLRVLHLSALRDGWLGMVAALQAGLERARGTLILFADADVHLEPGVLERLVALFEHHGLDHLTLLPRFVTTGPMQGALMAAFSDGYCQRAHSAGALLLPERVPAVGYGAFNLVRRAALERTAGLAWLRMDVLDDVALGELLRRAGARRGFLVADEGVSMTWYESLGAALRSFDKNFFGGVARYSFARALLFVAGMPVLALAPWLLLLCGPLPGWPLLVLAAAAHAAGSAVAALRLRKGLLHALLSPLAQVLGVIPMTRGALIALRQGGISWRGTRYSLEALRAGRRVGFP